jgi:hypothetical protein
MAALTVWRTFDIGHGRRAGIPRFILQFPRARRKLFGA